MVTASHCPPYVDLWMPDNHVVTGMSKFSSNDVGCSLYCDTNHKLLAWKPI